MSEDRRTKAQLIAALTRLEGDFERIVQRNAELHGQLADKPVRVPEAEALAGCVRALDPIAKKIQRDVYGISQMANVEVEQVVRHLMGRYNLKLVERLVEPCSRKHLDEASESDLINRIRGEYR